MPRPTVNELVHAFSLQPHPEGGFYRETYRAKGSFGARNYSSAIYFLLPRGKKSCLHRIASDEIWHFYLGGPMTLVQISPEGRAETVVLGQDIARGEKLQHVVPAGSWFGGFPNDGSEYSFVGCTVSPGFDFADFELAKRDDLIARFHESAKLIQKLTD